MSYGPGDFPVCEKVAAQILSLPMFPQLTSEQQGRVVEEIVRFAESSATAKPASRESVELATAERTA